MLTKREREVFQLIADGCSRRVIAKKLGISVKTVDTHVLNVRIKWEARTVPQCVAIAMRNGEIK